MTDKTFTFTIEQIKQIFEAGIRRGAEEEASFQCGSRTCGGKFDQCVETVFDIVNEGKKWGEEDWVDIFVVDSWFK
jgi:hypothetical protein